MGQKMGPHHSRVYTTIIVSYRIIVIKEYPFARLVAPFRKLQGTGGYLLKGSMCIFITYMPILEKKTGGDSTETLQTMCKLNNV